MKKSYFLLKLFNTILFLMLTATSIGQTKDWTKDEQKFYTTIKSLYEHFKDRTYDTSQRNFLFKKYVHFDHILRDASKTRIQERVKVFDVLFYKMMHVIDSIGLDNLDARPTRFFKSNKPFFDPFEEDRELNELLPFTLTYFDKRRPNEPMGALLFEPKTHKLISWVMVDQGGYFYFLTFNLF
jgi:hypothetical protein